MEWSQAKTHVLPSSIPRMPATILVRRGHSLGRWLWSLFGRSPHQKLQQRQGPGRLAHVVVELDLSFRLWENTDIITASGASRRFERKSNFSMPLCAFVMEEAASTTIGQKGSKFRLPLVIPLNVLSLLSWQAMICVHLLSRNGETWTCKPYCQ